MNAYLVMAIALVFGPIVGALLMGVDRKLTARMQGRIGPPIIQPIYDLVKLFRKEPLAVNQFQIIYAYLHLAFIMIVVVLLALQQDMLMILFAHAFSSIALILGGMSVRSPYSRIGSHRMIMQMLSYEPILVMMAVGIYLATGRTSFMSSVVFTCPKPLLLSLPLIFVTYLMAMAIKLQKSPFDVATSHHAHQEIVKGVTLEYSGPFLGLIELAHCYEVFIMFAIVAAFWMPNLLIGIGLAAGSFVALILLDNLTARLSTLWMVRFMWTMPMLLAVSNIVWRYMR